MNILFLARRFWPDTGGVEKHILEVSRCLINQGHTVTILAETSTKNIDEYPELHLWRKRYISDKKKGDIERIELEAKNKYSSQKKGNIIKSTYYSRDKNNGSPNNGKIILVHLPNVKDNRIKKLIIWLWLWKHLSIFQSQDVVHCHDVFYWYLPFRIFYRSKKVFNTFHGYEGYPIKKKAIFLRKLFEKLSDGNITIGHYLTKWYKTKPTYISYGAIHPEVVHKPIRRANNTPLKILLLGRLDKDIGVASYVEAIKSLKSKNIPFTFEVCGDGNLRSEVTPIGTIHGFVEDVESYIAQADIVFSASYLSILEALKYKKYIISVYENPLKEDILRMTPYANWIHITDTSEGIVELIEQYWKKTVVTNMDDAYNWVITQTWEHLTSLYLTLWKGK